MIKGKISHAPPEPLFDASLYPERSPKYGVHLTSPEQRQQEHHEHLLQLQQFQNHYR